MTSQPSSDSQLSRAKVVAIGGGHGLGRILSSLSDLGSNVTGIVATTDNGGSTGRIRASMGGIAWGDTRNCINQLITEPSIGSMLFEYRFRGNGDLNGHNLGNLILSALDNLCIRPLEAINLIREILHVDTYILPMSEHPTDLAAWLPDGSIVSGETSIDELQQIPKRLLIEPSVPATKETLVAIKQADLILLGPGSFLTSIMPPLLLSDLAHELKVCDAPIYFIANLDKEKGPAGKMSLETMLHWCERAMGGRKIDGILSAQHHPELAADYEQVVGEFASRNHEWRHDRQKLKNAVESLLIRG
ncbi:uridine diphosphate-N-acetylglucosamine-binding protein YvcK [Photobacterium sp. 1_MG-2023]|uniref:uridine diphosphate-N-acetylglucosamine-binding protein YvcK n=1 Tax=Photobacterium sp. 1_MG-2023 TaxID=3062646 RepID=UPI0026E38CDE|nr:uridine diphosphate-N-acetylglucosamine-binding protein YvcK [Photobacterium sp. 1_MG-2023]MDO6705810.1 uridine diphosphate-N-acetylglucosamine-binding protein YvcK [Photobacterium sp. 1_MG-2023]